jgi:hypothetical protein
MKRIDKAELYQHVSGFLKSKGIELTEGSYAVGVKKSCSFLADAINISQQGIERARTEVDKNVDKLRQVIHEKTAPKSAANKSAGPEPAPAGSANSSAKAKTPRNQSRPRRKTTRGKGRR